MFSNDYLTYDEYFELVNALDIKSDEVFDVLVKELIKNGNYNEIVKCIKEAPLTEVYEIFSKLTKFLRIAKFL